MIKNTSKKTVIGWERVNYGSQKIYFGIREIIIKRENVS